MSPHFMNDHLGGSETNYAVVIENYWALFSVNQQLLLI